MTEHTITYELQSPCPDLPAESVILRAAEICLEEAAGFVGRACEISLSVVCDEDMRRINKEQRGKDYTTDVLSFPMLEFSLPPGKLPPDTEGVPPGIPLFLGDVIISCETCLRQAVEIGHSVQDEFLRLMVHGFLHLLGYDHERSGDEERLMRGIEDRIMDLLSDAGI